MANFKTGLAYYNVDTDRYQDIKIKRLKKDFGCSGIAIYDYILCQVYRDKGCFLAWDENTAFDVADYFGVKETLINEIVQYCGAVGLFNRELLARGIVTSLSIQNRYIDMCNRAKRKDFSIPVNVKITEQSTIITEESNIITEQSTIIPEVCDKVKKSKVKKSKEDGINPPLPPLSKKNEFDLNFIELECFRNLFQEWLDFKREIKNGYKSQKSIEIAYARLLKLGNGNFYECRDIVYQSIGSNYKGLFELKDKPNHYGSNSRMQTKNAGLSRNEISEAVQAGIALATAAEERERRD